MNCEEVMELMQRHLDGDLNGAETSRLMNHVGHCPDCAAMLKKLVHLSRGLEQLPRVEPPYSLVDAILPKLDRLDAAPKRADVSAAAETRRRRQRLLRTWLPRITGFAALAAAVVLLLVNGPLMDRGAGGNRQEASGLRESSAGAALASPTQQQEMIVQDQHGGPADPTAEPAPAETMQPLMKAAEKDAPVQQPAQPRASARDTRRDEDMATRPSAPDGGALEETPSQPDPGAGEAGSEPGPGESATPAPEVALPDAPAIGEDPPMSIMGFQPAVEEAVSPDGQWKAVLTDGALQIFRTSDGALVYDQAPDGGKRSGLVWSEDSSAVYYTRTDAKGNEMPMALTMQDGRFAEIER